MIFCYELLQGLLDQLRPFDREIQSIQANKREVLDRKEVKLDELTKQKHELSSKIDELNKIQADIDT